MLRVVVIFICFFFLQLSHPISLSAQPGQEPLQKVKLQLKWMHQFEFAGYYAAIEKGFYREAGLDVELVLPHPTLSPAELVDMGKADFGIAGSDLIIERAEKKKIVALSVIFQHSPNILLVSRASGIINAGQLKDKTIALEPDSAEIISFLHSSMVFPKPKNIVPLEFDANQLIGRKVDAISAYLTDEPFLLDSIGFQYTILRPEQNNIDFYSDVLFTSEKLIRTNPELVEKFTKASLKGWNYAMELPYEIIFIILNKYSQRHSIRHLEYEWKAMKGLIENKTIEIGYMNPKRWEAILSEYKTLGLIDQKATTDGLLYQLKPRSEYVFDWRLALIRLFVLLIVSSLAFIFYRSSKNLKAEIKSREKIQSKLAESEALHRSILNASPDTITITDLDGNIQFASPNVLKMFGYRQDEVMNRSLFSFIHPDDRKKARNVIHQMFAHNYAGTSEYRGIRSDGEEINIEANGEFIRDSEERAQKMIFVSRDISERKIAEEKLRKSDIRFRQIVEQSQNVIWEVDTKGLYTYVSPAAQAIWGYSPEELMGKKHFYELHPEGARDEFRVAAFAAVNSHQAFKGVENQIICQNGDIHWVETNGIPVFDEQQNLIGYRGSDNDITARCEAETKIRQLNAGLEVKIKERTAELLATNANLHMEIEERIKIEQEMEKAKTEAEKANEAKSEFLSRMSHELRTPMNSILGFAQLLEMGQMNKAQLKGVQHILKSGKHLLNLINEVLDITSIESRGISLSMEPIEVAPVISEIIDSIRPLAAEREISIRFIPPPGNRLFVLADEQRLKQILINLINNGVKYNKTGGSLNVELQVIPSGSKEKPDQVRISFTDTGIGIRPESLPRLFMPFERIGAEQTNTEGSGLGLSVVKKLITVLSGQVGVESIPGEGSTFWIELPQVESPSEKNTADVELSGARLENKKGTILYVEDNLPNIELVEQMLVYHRPNIRLITHMQGKDTLKMASEIKPGLILLDLNLPDIHGSEIIDDLKNDAVTQSIPVVVVSADAMPSQVQKLKNLGAVEYLTKPLNVTTLLDIIDQVIPD